jgi:hypothetical protein
MATITAGSHASLRYVDTDGTGIPDGFVSVRVATVGWPDGDGRSVKRVVETRAVGIGDDGIPGHIHVHERVTESCDDGTERELTTHDVDLDADDPAAALALAEATGQDPLVASR